MTTLAEIEAAADLLSPEDRQHLEDTLRKKRELEHDEYMQALYRRTGVHPLPKRPGGRKVTDEDVRRIREELDI